MALDLSLEKSSTSMEDRPLATTCYRASEVSLTSNSRQIDWSTTAGRYDQTKCEEAHQEQQEKCKVEPRANNAWPAFSRDLESPSFGWLLASLCVQRKPDHDI